MLSEIQSITHASFEVWLDGSFVTKKAKPSDIDLVVFLPNRLIREQQTRLTELKEITNIDVYFVATYAPLLNQAFLEQSDRAYWYGLFTHTRPNARGIKHPKGFCLFHYPG